MIVYSPLGHILVAPAKYIDQHRRRPTVCKHIEDGSLVLLALEEREERPEEEEERPEILVITTFLVYPLIIGILVYCS